LFIVIFLGAEYDAVYQITLLRHNFEKFAVKKIILMYYIIITIL